MFLFLVWSIVYFCFFEQTKAQLKNHSDDENHDVSSTSTPLPQLRQWIENYEEAVTNHYSPELRARISNIRVNGIHTDTSTNYDPAVHKCRVHTQPLTTELKYLVATVRLAPNSPVIELRGKYMLSAQHRNSGGGNFNTRQHAQRPGPFLFFYRLHKDNTEVCVDTRTYGNSARFIRRSCKPNAELRHCIVKGVLHLYVVTITDVDKNVELTIKHESHDLAAIGTTHIACACGNMEECTVNKSSVKKNGEVPEVQKKRRGRRTASLPAPQTVPVEPEIVKKKEVEVAAPPTLPSPPPAVVVVAKDEAHVKKEELEYNEKNKEEKVQPSIKEEVKVPVKTELQEVDIKKELSDHEVEEHDVKTEKHEVKDEPPTSPLITTRRSSSHHKNSDKDDKDDAKEPVTRSGRRSSSHTDVDNSPPSSSESRNKSKKLSREERKLEAILRAIAQMEKADQRKQEHQAKQAHRRESEPGPGKEEDKSEPKVKRKRRKGRMRAASTQGNNRRHRLNSTDSYMTSGDETLLSPHDNAPPRRPSYKDASENGKNLVGFV